MINRRQVDGKGLVNKLNRYVTGNVGQFQSMVLHASSVSLSHLSSLSLSASHALLGPLISHFVDGQIIDLL